MGAGVGLIGHWVVVGNVGFSCGCLGNWFTVLGLGWLGLSLTGFGFRLVTGGLVSMVVVGVWVGFWQWRGFGCGFLVVSCSSVFHFLSLILNNGWFSRGDGVIGFVGLLVVGFSFCSWGCTLGCGVGVRLGLGEGLGMLSTIPSGLGLPL